MEEAMEAGFVGGTKDGLRIIFQELAYSVPSRDDKKQQAMLLSSISGFFEPYEMTALMGPSGSGKTTLLDVLAGRKTTGTISGDVRFGGASPSPAFLRRYTGYVEQFDTLIGSLTVKEMLMYTAELKRPLSEPYSSKAEAVRHLIDQLGLNTCANVPVGDPLTKGISGGQAKRTNIGIALISDPRVLFLDEPTSGLDSYSANEVVSLVQGLARSGTTVVATIHSPSAQAFAMFDRVLLLVRGRTTYFGPQGESALRFAREHWPGAGVQHVDCSAAEFLVDLVADADRNGQAGVLADAYDGSQLKQDNESRLAQYLSAMGTSTHAQGKQRRGSVTEAVGQVWLSGTDKMSNPAKSPLVPLSVESSSPNLSSPKPSSPGLARMGTLVRQLNTKKSVSTPWWWAVFILLKYRAVKNHKTPVWIGPRIADKFLFSFIILTLYLKTGTDFGQTNLVNLSASLFMWCSLPAFGAVAYVPSIALERKLFYRERADGLYYVGTYLLAKLIEELFLATLISVIFSSYVFYGVQYQGSFLLFWLVYLMTLANGIVLGYLIAAISPNMDVANAALPAYVVTLLFFAGQLATMESIPVYWRWYSTIDFVRYSWGAIMVNQFEFNDAAFTSDGKSILTYYSLQNADKWTYFGLLFAFFGVYTILGYLALSFIRHGKR